MNSVKVVCGFFYHLLLALSAHVAAGDGPEMMAAAASGLVLLAGSFHFDRRRTPSGGGSGRTDTGQHVADVAVAVEQFQCDVVAEQRAVGGEETALTPRRPGEAVALEGVGAVGDREEVAVLRDR